MFLLPAKIKKALSAKPLVRPCSEQFPSCLSLICDSLFGQTIYRHVDAGARRPKNEVTKVNIVDKIAKTYRIFLTEEQVTLDEPLKELGDAIVPIELARGFSCGLLVTVEPR